MLLLSAVMPVGAAAAAGIEPEAVVAQALEVAAWSVDPVDELEAFAHEVLDDEEAELGEDDDEVVSFVLSGWLLDRRPRTQRARGPPSRLAALRFELSRAPRGPPLA